MHFNRKLFSMFKLYISIILAALTQNVHCRPSEASANATATKQSQYFIGNASSTSSDNRVASFVSQIGGVEKQIDDSLNEKTPFLNLAFDSYGDKLSREEDCEDQMVILLVPQDEQPKEESVSTGRPQDLKEIERERKLERKNRYYYVPRDDISDDDSESSESEEDSDEY